MPDIPTLPMPKFPLAFEKGSVWSWEHLNPAERCQVEVLAAVWTGDEWYVQFEALENAGHLWTGMRKYYELNWFVEVAVLVSTPRGSGRSTRGAEATIELRLQED